MSTSRVAAIDCGTNSIRLLIADVDSHAGTLTDVERQMEIVRLGRGVDHTGELDPSALRRTFDAVSGYGSLIERSGAAKVRFVATSATRDARNRQTFTDGIASRLGIEPEVISGEQEAHLSFNGATRELAAREWPTPLLVVDIGGGSTEFVMGNPAEGVVTSSSVDIGCVRLTERHFRHDPPLPSEVSMARDDIDEALQRVTQAMPLRQAASVIGLAGSVTTITGLALGLWHYDPLRIHHAVTTAADVHRICEQLLYATHDQRASQPMVHAGRVDVISAGALILSTVLAHIGVSGVIASEHDILDGIAWSMVD